MKKVLILVIATFFVQGLFSQALLDQIPRNRVVVEVGTDVTG